MSTKEMNGHSPEPTYPSSIGNRRIRTNFNPSSDSVVDKIKQKSAELIDLLQALKAEEVVKPENSKTFGDAAVEKLRLISIAQTTYEEAAMWAVKAATA